MVNTNVDIVRIDKDLLWGIYELVVSLSATARQSVITKLSL